METPATSGSSDSRGFDFMIECVNVFRLGYEDQPFGFYATISVAAPTMAAGAASIPRVLREKMLNGGFMARNTGLFSTRCRIVEIYSFALTSGPIVDGDLGVSSYRMNIWTRLSKTAIFRLLEMIRPHMKVRV